MKLTAELIHGFSESVLARKYDNRASTPTCHLEWWKLCCSDHPLVAIAAPRNHAKSTAITHAYTLASVLFRDKDFVLIVSDTYDQAVLFLQAIASELKENEDLITLFDVKRGPFEKDAENDIIVSFKDGGQFRIVAKGSEQKVRGLKWGNKRPNLIICDDLENDEIVMNDDRRKKFKDWFLKALMPCRSDTGVIRIVGTILHMDSMLENLMPKLYDKKYTVNEPLRSHSTNTRSAWRSVRYRAHTGFDDFSQILWESRWPKERLLSERQRYVDSNTTDGYMQEYLNYPIDESKSAFRKTDFRAMTDDDFKKFKYYYIAVDPAITKKDSSDYTVFIVGGVDQEGIIYIVDLIRERMDALDIIETFFELQKKYDPELFIIEAGAIEKSLGPFLYAEMLKPGRQPLNLETKTPSQDKEFRARSIQARMRAGGCRFDKGSDWFPNFELECMQFPRAVHDDQVDAFAWLGLTLDKIQDAPTEQEMNQSKWEEDVEFYLYSDPGYSGVSATTGY
jgi:predicted phage terminase large subunit-like protein